MFGTFPESKMRLSLLYSDFPDLWLLLTILDRNQNFPSETDNTRLPSPGSCLCPTSRPSDNVVYVVWSTFYFHRRGHQLDTDIPIVLNDYLTDIAYVFSVLSLNQPFKNWFTGFLRKELNDTTSFYAHFLKSLQSKPTHSNSTDNL